MGAFGMCLEVRYIIRILPKVGAFFGNWYVVLTKHFMVGGNEIAGTLAYRYYLKEWNKKH